MKIAIEGIDLSGKSTLLKGLKKYLKQNGINPVFSFEPTPAGRAKLQAATKGPDFHKEAEDIFFADRKEHLEALTPHFEKNKVVILDRHILSSVAYQGAVKGRNPAEIAKRQLAEFAPADLTILLDLDVDEALKRAGNLGRRKGDDADAIFEAREHLIRSRKNYHTFLGITSLRSVVIDATRPKEEILQIALTAIIALVKGEGKMPQSVFCVPRKALEDSGFVGPEDVKANYRVFGENGEDPKKQLKALKKALCQGLWIERELAEKNPLYKQIIPSIVIQDPNEDVLYYIRKGKEKRLHDKLAVTIGGHIDPEDVAGASMNCTQDTQVWNLVLAAANRELQEELDGAFLHCGPLVLTGTVNDDYHDVGRVHFGIVMTSKCTVALKLRRNEELGLMKTAKPSELVKDKRAEAWAEAILKKL